VEGHQPLVYGPYISPFLSTFIHVNMQQLQHRVQEKVVHLFFGHNFCECRPIFKIHSLSESKGISLSTRHREFHLT